MKLKPRFLFIFLCLFTIPAVAQDSKKLHTDWPDQSEDVQLMKPGELQLENGFSVTRFATGNNAYITHHLIRYGLVNKLELRLIVEDGSQRDRYIEETSQSAYPLAAGAKLAICKAHGIIPAITLSGYLKLPFTSRSAQQTAYWSPSIAAAFENKLSKKMKLEYNIGLRQEAYSKDHAWFSTTGLIYDVSGKIGLFAEHFAQYQPGEQPQHNMNAGILYDFRKNMQLDIAAGTTILYDEPNRFVSIGFCYKLL